VSKKRHGTIKGLARPRRSFKKNRYQRSTIETKKGLDPMGSKRTVDRAPV
jgi:hypothetical protein